MLIEWWSHFWSLLPNLSDFGKMPEEAAPISMTLCVIGTLMLCKYTGGMDYVTLPVNFLALSLGMMTSNWLLNGIDFHVDKLFVQPILIHILGMTGAALMMLYVSARGLRSG